MKLFLALTVTLHSVHRSHMIKIHRWTCEISLPCGNAPLSRCACLAESFPPWLNWYVLDYGVFFGSPPCGGSVCIHFELIAVSLSMCCWAEYLSWELCGLEWAAFREPKLDYSCSLIIYNVNPGHLEFIMIGTSDRMVKLTKNSAFDLNK